MFRIGRWWELVIFLSAGIGALGIFVRLDTASVLVQFQA